MNKHSFDYVFSSQFDNQLITILFPKLNHVNNKIDVY